MVGNIQGILYYIYNLLSFNYSKNNEELWENVKKYPSSTKSIPV